MTADQWLRVRELFEAALEAAPPDPRAWLEAQPADAVVRLEVASLLDHHTQAGAFLENPIAERAPELLAEDEPLKAGVTIGHYKITREIGRGAMGRVYLADDVNLGRPVALKALAPTFTGDPSYRERLRREARAAAGMTHPGICTVHALEEFDGQLFIVSELVEGHTLRDEIGKGPLPDVNAITRTARQLADALAAAHARGITHRDFKPENVMRDRSGRLKVLDFGLAYAADAGIAERGRAGDHARRAGRHAGLHGARAAERRTGRCPGGRVCVRRGRVRICLWHAPVQRLDAARPGRPGARKRCAADRGSGPSHPGSRRDGDRSLPAQVGRRIASGRRRKSSRRSRPATRTSRGVGRPASGCGGGPTRRR